MALWLEFQAFTSMSSGLTPGWETEILQTAWHGQNIALEEYNFVLTFIMNADSFLKNIVRRFTSRAGCHFLFRGKVAYLQNISVSFQPYRFHVLQRK